MKQPHVWVVEQCYSDVGWRPHRLVPEYRRARARARIVAANLKKSYPREEFRVAKYVREEK